MSGFLPWRQASEAWCPLQPFLGAVEDSLQEGPQPPLPGPRAQLGGRGAPVQPDWEPVALRPGQLFQKTRQTAGSSQAFSQSPALAWHSSFHLLPVSTGHSRSLLSHKTFQGLPPLAGRRGLDTSAYYNRFLLIQLHLRPQFPVCFINPRPLTTITKHAELSCLLPYLSLSSAP